MVNSYGSSEAEAKSHQSSFGTVSEAVTNGYTVFVPIYVIGGEAQVLGATPAGTL